MNQKLRFFMLALLCAVLNVAWGADTWKETELSSLTTNDVFVIVGTNGGGSFALSNNNGTGSAPTAVSVTIENDALTGTIAGNIQWNISGNATDGYTFYPNGTTETWLYCTNTNNGVRVGTNNSKTFVIDGGYLKHSGTSRYVGIYNSQDWRCYTSNGGNIEKQTFSFYKKIADASAVADPTFSPSAGTYVSAQSVTISCGTVGATIYYTTDGSDPTTNSAVYSEAIPVSTTTTIKAMAVKSGMTNSNVASAVYTIKPLEHAGTQADPYSVTDARTAIDAGTGVTGVYATGIVSSVGTFKDGYITYFISSDGTTASPQLEAYKGKGKDGADFISADDIKVGDVVVIYGNLKKYNTTYEFDADNQLVSLEHPVVPAISVEEELELAYDATSGEIEYTIENPVEGKSLTAETTAEWISDITVGAESVTFTTTANESNADRTATIILAYEGAVSKTVTVTQKRYVAPVENKTYAKVTSTADITDGNYLIVYEEGSVAFDGSLETLDAVGNTIEVILNNGKTEAPENAAFTIDVTNGTIQSASGKYIGVSSNNNGLKQTENATTYKNTFSIDDEGNAVITASFEGSTMTLKYNSNSNQTRFRYYASGQKAIQLYKEVKDEPFPLPISSAATDGTSYFATMANIGNGNFIVPDGVNVSIVEVISKGKIYRHELIEAGSVIPGNEAYLVEAKASGIYQFVPTDQEAVEIPTGNMLYPTIPGQPTTGPDEAKSYVFYKLSLDKNGTKNSVGFYYGAANGAAFDGITANSAYLAVPSDLVQNTNAILINPDDDADGIQGISTSELKNAEVYTLTGVRVQGNLQKGIYIVNGRKQVIK